MSTPHPKLRLRPRRHPALQRPVVRHPVLGTLEYVNRNGSWWQGAAQIAGSVVRVDLETDDATIPDTLLVQAADALQWLQRNEPSLRAFVRDSLAHGRFDSNMGTRDAIPAQLMNSDEIDRLRPCFVSLVTNSADFIYSCDQLAGGALLAAHEIMVGVDEHRQPASVRLLHLGFDRRAERFFERPVPPGIADFVDGLADQFIAQAATGRLRLDRELRGLLRQAIENLDERKATAPADAASYLTAARHLLAELAATPETLIERILARLRFEHPSGKYAPVKERLVFDADSGFKLERPGKSAHVPLVFLRDHDEGMRQRPMEVIEQHLVIAANWLARQSDAAFQELRVAGYEMWLEIDVRARLGEEPFVCKTPPSLSSACGRLGLEIRMAVTNAVDD